MTGPRIDPMDAALAAIRARSMDSTLAAVRRPSDPFADVAGGTSSTAPIVDPDRFRNVIGGSSTTAPARTAPVAPVVKPVPATPNVLSHLTNIGRGFSGGRAVMAGSESMFNRLADIPDTYAEALRRQDADVGRIGGATSFAEHLLGAAPLAMALPAGMSPALGGALLGGADQALDADPKSLTARAVETGLGAAGGALFGRYAQKLLTGGKAFLAKSPAANVIGRQAERATSAKQMYDVAMAQGRGREVTQAVQDFLQEPKIAERIGALQELEQYKHLSATSPEMLDALANSLSDEANQLNKGLGQATQSKVNSLRAAAGEIGRLKDKLFAALETKGSRVAPAPATAQSPPPDIRTALRDFQARPGIAAARREGTPAQQLARQALERHGAETIVSPPLAGAPTATVEATPPYMPSYRPAANYFAQRTNEIKALGRGMNAMQGSERPTFSQIMSKDSRTPETLIDWAQRESTTPGERAAAAEGILGDVRKAFAVSGIRKKVGRDALTRANTLLRDLDPRFTDPALRATGLANAAFTTPFAQALAGPSSSIPLPPDIADPHEIERARKAAALHRSP